MAIQVTSTGRLVVPGPATSKTRDFQAATVKAVMGGSNERYASRHSQRTQGSAPNVPKPNPPAGGRTPSRNAQTKIRQDRQSSGSRRTGKR
jgi:hypothetical protein